jgi:N-methylhydantoinase B
MTTITNEHATATRRLRDLGDAAFAARYSCDRLTATILGNRFRYVNTHMAAKLRANAFSIVIRDMDDFCTTIQGPPELDWAMPAASLTNPVHWGPVTDAVRVVLEEIGLDTLRPGDVVVANDSYRTGKHLNDTSFMRPLFHDGRLVGALHVTAHQLDLGSRVPGGFDLTAQSIWEDGLVLTPMLLYSEGRPVRSTFNLVAANTRAPQVILSDLQVINSTLDLGEQLLLESIERYGLDAYLGSIRYACDVAAEEMTRALEILPDGDYDGEVVLPDGDDAEAPPAVRLRVRKRGERVEFDFSGTTAANHSALNCSWLDAKTGVMLALNLLFHRSSVPNSGSLRNFDFLLPADSFVNATPPTATMMYFSIVDAVQRVTINALNPALGENAVAFDTPMGGSSGHRASGTTPDGVPWQINTADGNPANFPKGATRDGDADGYGLLTWMNMPALSAEVLELSHPMLVLEAEAVVDSSGAGRHRGGPEMASTLQYLHAGTHHHGVAHLARGAAGAYGGGDGSLGAVEVYAVDPGRQRPLGVLPPEDETPTEVPPGGNLETGAGAIFRSRLASGGGWGAPFSREPERVVRDVRDGYVTVEGAANHYGVVVVGDPVEDPEHLTFDAAATARLRASRSGS